MSSPLDVRPARPLDSVAASEPATDLPLDPESALEALYRLETWVRCPSCKEEIDTVGVVRLLRERVNFTSTLPRKGQLTVCPRCRAIVPAQLGGYV